MDVDPTIKGTTLKQTHFLKAGIHEEFFNRSKKSDETTLRLIPPLQTKRTRVYRILAVMNSRGRTISINSV